MNSIEVHDLTVSYQRKPALWGVDFTLPTGVMAGIVGPNGAGKSTLIKAIMGLLPIDSGYVKLFDKPVDEVRNQIAYVPQRGTVDWHFPASVIDVVQMGRYRQRGLWKRLQASDKKIAFNCLEQVGLQDFANRQISQLSGGQQQRVFIARALAQEATLYLLDEPFAGIDASSEEAIFKLLESLRDTGKTLMVVHHDLQSAYRYFDWMILLNTRLVGAGPKEKMFTAAYLQETYGGKLNMLAALGEVMSQMNIPPRKDQVL